MSEIPTRAVRSVLSSLDSISLPVSGLRLARLGVRGPRPRKRPAEARPSCEDWPDPPYHPTLGSARPKLRALCAQAMKVRGTP